MRFFFMRLSFGLGRGGVSGCLFCLRFLGAFLPVFGFGFAAALFGLSGYGGKVLRQKVKILRRGGRRRVSSFLPARPDAAAGFRPPARLGRQDKRLGICVLLLSLSQQGFAVGLFGLVGGLAGAGGHGGRLVDVWIGIGAGGEQDKGCD